MTITKEGALASFYTVNKAPIKHLRVYFSPKQAGEGDPSPENVREISGHTGIELTHCGKNIFDKSTGIQLQSVNLRVARNPGYGVPVQLKSGIPYVFSQNGKRKASEIGVQTPYTGIYIKLTYETYLKYTPTADEAVALNAYWEGMKRPEDSTDFQVEIGTQATEYEPYRGQTHTLDWTDEVGTVYGGYVDLVTGELVQEWAHVVIDENLNFWNANRQNMAGIYFYKEFRNELDKQCLYNAGKLIESIAVEKSNKFAINNSWGEGSKDSYTAWAYSTSDTSTTVRFGFPSELNITTVEQAKNWFIENGPVEIIYPLVSPITHQLTPTQLSTLIGRNNIWSNADRVEVEYDLAESNDELYRRRNILLRSAPHIETVSGNITHFETDIAAPIKSAKISFSPIQEGNGDPSPENVRTISGWSGINLYSTKKILASLLEEIIITGYPVYIPVQSNNALKAALQSLPEGEYAYSASFINYDSGYRRIDFYDFDTATVVLSLPTGSDTNGTYNGTFTITKEFKEATGIRARCYGGNYGVEPYPTLKSLKITPIGTTLTEADEYTQTTIPLDWQTAAGTIYGGYVDLITGELIVTYKLYHFDSSLDSLVKSPSIYSNAYRYSAIAPDSNKERYPIIYSNKFKAYQDSEPPIYGISVNENGRIIVTVPDSISTVEDFKLWLDQINGFDVVYPIESIIYQLTPQALKSLKGTNNIWSNANNGISIQYYTH